VNLEWQDTRDDFSGCYKFPSSKIVLVTPPSALP
jgi:hypothetical protein